MKSGFSAAIFRELEKKNILETYFHEIGRISDSKMELSEVNTLNDFQVYAYNSIIDSFNKRDVCLLHGVTSSGKTEIYINLIHKVLQAGKQVLYLLPEIALTTQITERLKKVFGDRLGIYHSKFSDAERVEIWQKQLTEKQYDVILGVRSSIFLPFTNLGLVIIYEEHDNSYKQQYPAPRYHARSAAIMLASRFRSKVLL
jgi:primosomal protein N' (replication factor Y)